MSIKSNAIFLDVSHREPHQKLDSQLTRNNITLIQTQLTTLQNCIRPIRLGRLIKSLILIILFPCQLLRIKFRSDDLQIMMMRLVLIVRHIDIPIKGSCRFQKSRGSIDQPLLDEIFREGFTKAQVIMCDMRQIVEVKRRHPISSSIQKKLSRTRCACMIPGLGDWVMRL